MLGEADAMLDWACQLTVRILMAEHLRLARVAFDALVGRATTEDMLDALFARFCIGK
jgi:tRNA modification GTPase